AIKKKTGLDYTMTENHIILKQAASPNISATPILKKEPKSKIEKVSSVKSSGFTSTPEPKKEIASAIPKKTTNPDTVRHLSKDSTKHFVKKPPAKKDSLKSTHLDAPPIPANQKPASQKQDSTHVSSIETKKENKPAPSPKNKGNKKSSNKPFLLATGMT